MTAFLGHALQKLKTMMVLVTMTALLVYLVVVMTEHNALQLNAPLDNIAMQQEETAKRQMPLAMYA